MVSYKRHGPSELYPDDYETGMVKGVIDAIKGLSWTQAASDLYVPEQGSRKTA